jgi:acylaminoacyl-peptidase
MIRPARTTLSLVTLLVLLSSAGTAQSDRLSASDVFDMEFATNPQISPDGQWVVYVRQFADIMTDRRYSNLWILRADGSDHRPLTSGHFGDHTPRWSPDGARLAYISDRSGSSQIHVRWMDSRQTATVTNVTEPPSGVEWSPDGRQLAFLKLVPEAPLTIVDMPEPPSGATWAEPPQIEDKLIYRFDGVGDLEPGFVHLFVMPSEGGTPRQVSQGNFQHGERAWGGSGSRWTPGDGVPQHRRVCL